MKTKSLTGENSRSFHFYGILQPFIHGLRRTPLLTGWLVLGLLAALLVDGRMGLVFGVINLFLIGLYAMLIRWMTPHAPSTEPVKKPVVEMVLAFVLFGLFLATQLLDFGVWNVQPLQSQLRGFFASLQAWVYQLDGIPGWAQQDLFLALSSSFKKLVPTLLLFYFLRYGRRGIGLVRPHWKLTAILVGTTAAFGLFTGFLTRAPFGQVLGLYLIGIFVNALPEELFFRAFLLPRLEKVFANPLNALVVSALMFNAMHIPIQIANGIPPVTAILDVFSMAYPSGLTWGYLYLRTRSIIPGTLWHAANGNLGFFLLSA